jgi:hypothetical protein
LQDPATRDEAFGLIRSVIEETRLAAELLKLRVGLGGEPGRSLPLSTTAKNPAAIMLPG